MTTPNLERLVENYVSGDTAMTDLHIKPTYHMYDQLFKLLSSRGRNIQQAMTAILPMLHKDVTVPSKISNNPVKSDNISILVQMEMNLSQIYFQLKRMKMK